ncbi:MAG: AMP-binding protein [Proteobacteria bacterium]|nr:AMP-binding protein [Pseudomonadota bacterium]MBI3499580.1 AMP-binding protein [Pseudomonadota bacterium]
MRLANADTFPKVLLVNAKVFADRAANREKDLGIWQTWTWAQVLDEVRWLALGLAAMGFRRGDKLAIVGDNRPHLYWAITAVQALGGVPVPVYQDAVATEMQFVLDHCEARFAIAEDQEQVDKLLGLKERCPLLEAVIYADPRGLRNYPKEQLRSYASVQEEGRKFEAAHPGFFLEEIAKGKAEDVAIILYTSGTTGQPKGVMLSQRNIMATSLNWIEREGLNEHEESLAYLPMAWVGDHVFSYGQAYVAGFAVGCPESGATVMTDLRELGPTYFFAPPRIYENILTTVMIRMEDASYIKRRLFHYFMTLARRIGTRIIDEKPVSLLQRLLYGVGHVLVYGPLKNTLGFSRIRLAYTAGEAIGPDIFDFFRSLGINVKQLYGMTEASVALCIQPDGEVKPDTVGTPVEGVEIKITDTGEVMYRSPGVFVAYYKNERATQEAKAEDGWVHSGDAGFFDADGHLKIIDRSKDVGRLNDGTLFAPKYLENKLKFFPHIKEAVAFGHGRDHAAAMINIDMSAVGDWAERRGIAYSSYQELAAMGQVYDLVRGCIEAVNADLAHDRTLAGSQIKRFLILHKELDADDGELTRTRKVRRGFVAERYQPLVDGLYSSRERAAIETDVTFEDGRKSKSRAEIRIAEAQCLPAAAPPAEPEPLRKAG